MLIGELSDRTGVSTRALRHYDRFGLLPSRRRSNRHRDFTDDAVWQVRRIRLLLGVGLDLDAVRRLLPCFADDGSLTACPAARDRLRAEIRTLDERLATVRTTRRMLVDLLAELEDADQTGRNSR